MVGVERDRMRALHEDDLFILCHNDALNANGCGNERSSPVCRTVCQCCIPILLSNGYF